MNASLDWESFYADYVEFVDREPRDDDEFIAPSEFVSRISNPSPYDLAWLRKALREKGYKGLYGVVGRKWLVAWLAHMSPSLAPELFEPMMEAAVDESDPSLNRQFLEPPIASLGLGRVEAYLLDVLEFGTPFRKANAVNAGYWLHPIEFDGEQLCRVDDPIIRNKHYEELAAFGDREYALLLENFVNVDDVHLRRCIIRRLDLNLDHYTEKFLPLARRARAIALNSKDEFIRAYLDSRGTWRFPGLPPREDLADEP